MSNSATIPKAAKGPMGPLTWFKLMARKFGDHPRVLRDDFPDVLTRAGIDVAAVDESLIRLAERECLPLAKEQAEEHNQAVARGEAAGTIVVHDEYWLTGRHPDPSVHAALFRKNENPHLTAVDSDGADDTNDFSPQHTHSPAEGESEMTTATEAAPKFVVQKAAIVPLLIELKYTTADKWDKKRLAKNIATEIKSGQDQPTTSENMKLYQSIVDALNAGQEIEVVDDGISDDSPKPDDAVPAKPKRGKKGGNRGHKMPTSAASAPKRKGDKSKGKKADAVKAETNGHVEPAAVTEEKPKKGGKNKQEAADKKTSDKADRAAKRLQKDADGTVHSNGVPIGKEAAKDKFGSRIGSNFAKINAALSRKPKTVPEIVEQSGAEVKYFVSGEKKEAQLGGYYKHMKNLLTAGHVEKKDKGYVLAK